ncbi:MAG: phytanoyl-CoA dioxygenase family protein [Myxococcota bacterium]|jgi:ectoine hydroxylase-related dioxygenase (phytanoyl-CoA dioxygenase family)|nr:phytanoyl-CoA dioxygenase family protein [Myxococcota bacterium]
MLLLPEHFDACRPFEDSSSLRDDDGALHRRAHEQGYLYVRGLVPPDTVAELRRVCVQVAAEMGWVRFDAHNPSTVRPVEGAGMSGRGWDDPRFVEMQRRVCFHPAFYALVRHPVVLQVMAAVFGEEPDVAYTNHVWLKLPGSPEHTTSPHQDLYYLPKCPQMWSLWFPLVDTPMPVGPLGIVPGSHHSLLPHVDNQTGIALPRQTQWVSGDVVPGDVVAFHVSTIHCAWSNVSPDAVRISLDVRYEPASTPDSLLRLPT